ncbi:hypothetical protein PBRA_009577 [Plasmodiophora brassicae]|uniref:Uncharacterized protein n=1 Tax=Plasmodiophora brassicae TaxID=37360 RepID=A0A0G4J8W4_PLABS|nr:hypothetical protein PBRA_009577 [Plasmodiophora brassicae]
MLAANRLLRHLVSRCNWLIRQWSICVGCKSQGTAAGSFRARIYSYSLPAAQDLIRISAQEPPLMASLQSTTRNAFSKPGHLVVLVSPSCSSSLWFSFRRSSCSSSRRVWRP